jgi:hypothetical protein
MDMDTKSRIGKFRPKGDSRASRMLALGRLTVTITSRQSRQHVTLRLRCKAEGENGWEIVSFDEATHVFIEDYDGELVATYYPTSGVLYYKERATMPARWSVQAILRHLGGNFSGLPMVAEVAVADLCGRCGQPLTDPESIERGFGQDCFGVVTSSRHAKMWRDGLPADQDRDGFANAA